MHFQIRACKPITNKKTNADWRVDIAKLSTLNSNVLRYAKSICKLPIFNIKRYSWVIHTPVLSTPLCVWKPVVYDVPKYLFMLTIHKYYKVVLMREI